jgi:formate dehydrogenase subunit delta
MPPDRLDYMANQIAKFFAHEPEDKAVIGIAGHIKSFWEKRMLSEIYAHLDAGGEGLDPRVKRALQSLRTTTST